MRPTTKIFTLALLSATALAALPNAASATNGMNPICYGTDNCGMGGAGVALGKNTAGAILNPALSGRAGKELLVSMGWLHADVEGQVRGTSGLGGAENNKTTSQDSRASDFADGTLALNWKFNEQWAVNLAAFPGGGGATNWKDPRTTPGAGGDHQIRTRYFFLQPSASYTPPQDKDWTFGVGAVISRQDMKTDSLDNQFGNPRPGPRETVEAVWGAGFHLGAVWQPKETFSVGASYRSPIWAERYRKYQNVFSGPMNMPQQFIVGLSGTPMPKLTLAGDVKYIDWQGVSAIGNAPGGESGVATDGGFGWKSQIVFLAGAAYEITDKLTGRIGYNYGESPIDENHVFANFLFPAITEHHLTAGGSYKLTERYELGGSAYWAPENTLRNNPAGTAGTFARQGGTTELSHQQYGAQVSVKVKF